MASSEPVFPIKPPGGATGSSMTVETGMDRPANQRENPTAARSHVAIDETTVSANGISEASNSVHAGARNTVVPDGPIVLRPAELNFLEPTVGGGDHTLCRGLDDASSDLNVNEERVVALAVLYEPIGSVVIRPRSRPTVDDESRDSGDLVPRPVMVSAVVTHAPRPLGRGSPR